MTVLNNIQKSKLTLSNKLKIKSAASNNRQFGPIIGGLIIA